jgi:hypothetical protein
MPWFDQLDWTSHPGVVAGLLCVRGSSRAAAAYGVTQRA